MKGRFIIGIGGKARSGKDTCARLLTQEYGFKRFAFADRMKKIVCDMFGWDERHMDGELKEIVDPQWGFSPREAFQKFGTEFGRALNKDLWIIKADRALGEGLWVISDVRKENEADFIRQNGLLFYVDRPGFKTNIRRHSSENGFKLKQSDLLLINNSTIEELHGHLRHLLDITLEAERWKKKDVNTKLG